MVKLIMTWNVQEGKEAEFLEFINNDFARLFLAMNVQPTEAWYAIWGKGPQAMICGVARDLKAMDRAMASNEWEQIRGKMEVFARDFRYKVVEKAEGFQM